MSLPSRRAFLGSLASAGTVALAGCSGPLATGNREPALSYELTMDRVGESLAPRFLWEPATGDSPRDAARNAAVRAAAAGERPTTYGYEPVPDDEYVAFDGTYYALDVVATGLERMKRSVLTCSWVGDLDVLEDPPEYVRHEDLPRLDRHAIKPAYFAARARRRDGGGAPWELIEEGGYVYRHLDEGTSELAPEPEHDHVLFNGAVLDVRVEQVTLDEPAYTGVRIPVAESEAAFERALDAEHVDARVDGSEISEQARGIVVRDSYEETTPLSGAFREVIRALQLRELSHVNDDRTPEAKNGLYLAYDDAYYRYGLYVNPTE